jgi:hypothetical protein
MQFKVPKTYSDLTLGQLMMLNTEIDATKRVAYCTDTSKEDLRKMPAKEIAKADEHLMKIKDEEIGRHFKTITLDGKEYGFIPDWNEFSLGEWIDIEEYCKDFWGNAHKILAVLYREVHRSQGEAYTIKPYTAKEETEVFKQLPARVFGGSMVFFFTSRRRLLNTLQQSLVEVSRVTINSLKYGDGTPSYITLQMRSYSRFTRLRSWVQRLFSRTLRFSKT